MSSLNKINVLRLVAFCIAIACLTSLMHCHRDQPKPKTELEKLPAATQAGAYTFGCLVNGKAWVVQNSLHTVAIDQVNFSLWGSIQNNSQNIFFFIQDPGIVVKSYLLNDRMSQYAQFSNYTDINNSCECYADGTTGNGILNITKFDQTKLIVSGTFNFTAWNTKCDTIKVTEGRFDLHYTP